MPLTIPMFPSNYDSLMPTYAFITCEIVAPPCILTFCLIIKKILDIMDDISFWPFTSSLVVLNFISSWLTSTNSRNILQVHKYAHYCLISSVQQHLCHPPINQTNHQAKFWKILKPCLRVHARLSGSLS